MLLRLRSSLSLLALLLLTSGLARAQETQVVAISDTPAPDGNGTIASFITDPSDPEDSFTNSSGPILNDAGQIAFVAYLTGTAGGPGTPTDDSGIFLYDDGEVVQLVREGQASPDGDGVFGLFKPLFEPGLNNAGQVVFQHPLRNSENGEFFAWGAFSVDADGSDLSVLIRDGNATPSGEDTVSYVGSPAITDNGLVSFGGQFVASDPLGESGMFRGNVNTGDVLVVARENDGVPEGDGLYNLINGGDINEAGQLVFSSSIKRNGSGEEGIYLVEPDGTTVTKVVRTGDPSPNGDGVVSIIPSRPAINDAGQLVYATVLAPCTNCAPTGGDLLRYKDGETVTIARTGQPAPGGGEFVNFFRPNAGLSVIVPALNERGQVGFYGTVFKDGFFFTGFYRGDGTETIRVVDDDQRTPSGIDYFNFGCLAAPAFDCDDSFKMNERGQFAFFTTLRNTNIEVNEGIFFYDDALGMMKVVRKGDELLGSPITQLRFTAQGSNAQDNARSGLNNAGQVAYVFELADGRSGIALWTPPARSVANETQGTTPTEFAVTAAYPNPFRESAALRFTLPAADDVRLAVYDVLGRRVITRDLGPLGEGTHTADLDGEALAPGVYIARLTTGSREAVTVRLVKAD